LFPSYAWIPGVVVREALNITVPDSIDAPYGYTLALSLWDFDQPGENLGISGDLPQLYENTIALTQLTALNPDPLPPAPDSEQFSFDHEIRMEGFEAPASASPGETITFKFWWRAGNTALSDYAFFLHLLPDDSANAIIFNQTPLGGKLPTANWIPGLTFVDTWEITIPEDAPPGEYQILSGLYHQITGERLPVTGIDGALTRDASMVLGSLEIVE
jgi:hypothetical protein